MLLCQLWTPLACQFNVSIVNFELVFPWGSTHSEVFDKKSRSGKHLCLNLLVHQVAGSWSFINESPAQVLLCTFCKIFQLGFFLRICERLRPPLFLFNRCYFKRTLFNFIEGCFWQIPSELLESPEIAFKDSIYLFKLNNRNPG